MTEGRSAALGGAATVWLKRLVGVVVLLVVWQVVVLSRLVPATYFPSVPTIAAALAALIVSPGFLQQIVLTWMRTLVGLAIAIVLGLAIAVAAGRYAWLRRMLEPVVEMLRVLPPPAIVPISIFAIGLGQPLFLFIIAFAALWPIYINAANALAAAEPVQMLTGRSFGYSRWEILLRLRLPAALPEIVTGVRLAASIALLAAVAAEMLAGENGLGFVLYNAAFTLRIADMFAIMVVVGISGLLLNLLVARASRVFIGWHLGLSAMGEAL